MTGFTRNKAGYKRTVCLPACQEIGAPVGVNLVSGAQLISHQATGLFSFKQ